MLSVLKKYPFFKSKDESFSSGSPTCPPGPPPDVSHGPTTPHGRGEAADIRYPKSTNDADQMLCCARKCGAGNARDEKRNPSSQSTAPHVHVQIPKAPGGSTGDLPVNNDCCKPK